MNILITSAGRRVSLIRSFQSTLKEFDENGKVLTIDMNPSLSAACQISDKSFKAPRVTDESYVLFLKELCREEKISIIIPTIDTELSILATLKEEFLKENILIAVSSKEVCDIFAKKSSTFEFFSEHNIKTPKIINDIKNASFPLFAKKDNSSLSIGAGVVNSYTEAQNLLEKDSSYIFQELIDAREFTVDVFVDSKKEIISIVPRERLEVRGGEVAKAYALKDEDILREIKSLVNKIDGAYGILTIQLFKSEKEIIFIEINPRFGGGYPLSYSAGANYAKYLIKDYLKIEQSYDESWRDKTVMLRYDAEVIVNDYSL